MELIAIRPFLLAGRIINDDEPFETSEAHGRALISKGIAREPDPDTPIDADKPSRRPPRRRD